MGSTNDINADSIQEGIALAITLGWSHDHIIEWVIRQSHILPTGYSENHIAIG